MKIRCLVMLLLMCTAASVFAQRKMTIKMASPIPENTPWGQCLNQIASEWNRITNGQIEVIIYHNGTAGNEKEMVQKLRVNQVQAAVLSSFGIYELSPEVLTVSCPFLIKDDDELDAVLTGVKGELEEKINAKGYFTLAWARVGWVKIFSKSPVFVPEDLKKQKLGTNAEQADLNQAFKTMGFQMIPVARNDILIALNSGMVDAVYESPIAVGSTQVFGLAKNMASINIAPFMGGIILNQRTWGRIPERYKPQLIEAARKAEKELDGAVRELEDGMIKTMGNYGLKVNQLNAEQEQLWHDEIGKAMPSLIGTTFDRNVYNRIEAILRDYRDRQR